MSGMDIRLPVQQIVDGGFCSGCGACAYAADGAMRLNHHGEYEPDLASVAAGAAEGKVASNRLSEACPFLEPELNEDALAKPLFEEDCRHDTRIGFHHTIFATYVKEDSFRARGTSGGVGTWLGVELLRQGQIDGVIHVKPQDRTDKEDPFFGYAISRSSAEIREGAKTRYHVVELSQVMREVRERPGRYLFVGVPCMCKAVRRLQRLDPVLKERIPFVASLVCGHLKSVHWTLSLAWGGGIPPADVGPFQYRTKDPNISARAYVYRAESRSTPAAVQQDSSRVAGGKWNTCAMMLNACDYCDDVVGETADITIGDAWLPKYTRDHRGTNLLILRNPVLTDVIKAAGDEDRLVLEDLSADEAAASQAGGLRHRREGLSFRLAEATAAGTWAPVKRIAPGSIPVSDTRKDIYRARSAFAKASKDAFRRALDADDYTLYADAMRPYEKRFLRLEIGTTPLRRLLLATLGETRLRKLLHWRRVLPQKILRLLRR